MLNGVIWKGMDARHYVEICFSFARSCFHAVLFSRFTFTRNSKLRPPGVIVAERSPLHGFLIPADKDWPSWPTFYSFPCSSSQPAENANTGKHARIEAKIFIECVLGIYTCVQANDTNIFVTKHLVLR